MDQEAMRDYELSERAALEAERRQDEADFDEEEEPEPSEYELATQSLDREHFEDFLKIKHTIQFSDLSERLVDMAVKAGLKERT